MDFVYISYKLKLPDVFFFKSCALTCIISEDRDEDLVLKDASDHSVGKMVIKIIVELISTMVKVSPKTEICKYKLCCHTYLGRKIFHEQLSVWYDASLFWKVQLKGNWVQIHCMLWFLTHGIVNIFAHILAKVSCNIEKKKNMLTI